MNPPLFDVYFERGPFDGWQVTTDYLPSEGLTLPARPGRAALLRGVCRGGAPADVNRSLSHYALAGKQMVLVHGIPVVRMRFRFQGVWRQQSGRQPAAAGSWIKRLRSSLAWWLHWERDSALSPGGRRMESFGRSAASPLLPGPNHEMRG
jgi:hypothetical protein